MEASNEQLSRTERKLVELATDHVDDVYLSMLVNRAQDGIGTPIVLLTNAMIMAGTLTSSRDMAVHLDAECGRRFDVVEKPEDVSDADWETARERSHHGYTSGWDKGHEEEDEFLDGLPEDDDAPLASDDEARLIEFQRKAFVTMKDVRIHAPGAVGGSQVKVLRVPVRQINAWWVPESTVLPDGTTRASIKIWGSMDGDDGESVEG